MARMERLATSMPHSTVKAFRRYALLHDVDLCVAAKTAVTDYCRMTPPPQELMDRGTEMHERMFVSMPDTAMRLLELWSENTGIQKQQLLEWAIRKLAHDQIEMEEDRDT